jgi:hypothetical protein
MMTILVETCIGDIPDIQHNVTLLRGIPENDFQDRFRQWHHRLTEKILL